MKRVDTLRNILYAASHANQLIDDSTKYHQLLEDLEIKATWRDEWESKEENIQEPCTVTPAKELPQGWQWEDHRNPGGGDGYLKSPDGKMYFPYVLEPHSTGAEENLEYFDFYRQYEQVLPETGKLSDFKAYAESEMKRNLLSRDEGKEWNPLPKYTQANNLPAQTTEEENKQWLNRNPVGRIDYYGSNGKIRESREVKDELDLAAFAMQDAFYGETIGITVYSDPVTGDHMDTSWLMDVDPPPIEFHIEPCPVSKEQQNPVLEAEAPDYEP